MTPPQLENAIGYAYYAYYFRAGSWYEFFTQREFALVLCHTEENLRRKCIALARSGHRGAHELLCGMADFLADITADPLPVWLQKYIVSVAQLREAPKRRGRNPSDDFLRDMAIGRSVEMVTQRFNLRATRNDATTAECGCSIVAIALDRYSDFDMSEANVVAIWRRTVGGKTPSHGEEAELPVGGHRELLGVERALSRYQPLLTAF